MKPWSQGWLIAAGVYPGFCSMKRLEAFLLPLDGMLVHRRSLPRNFSGFSPTICRYPFIHLGGEKHCESKVSCPRTQNTESLARARTRTARSGVERTNHEATSQLHKNTAVLKNCRLRTSEPALCAFGNVSGPVSELIYQELAIFSHFPA